MGRWTDGLVNENIDILRYVIHLQRKNPMHTSSEEPGFTGLAFTLSQVLLLSSLFFIFLLS